MPLKKLKAAKRKGPIVYYIYIQGTSSRGKTGHGGWTAEVWQGSDMFLGATWGVATDATNESLYLNALSNGLDILTGIRPPARGTKKPPVLFPLNVGVVVFTNLANIIKGIEGPNAPFKNQVLWLSVRMKWSMFMNRALVFAPRASTRWPYPGGLNATDYFKKLLVRSRTNATITSVAP